MAGIERTRSAEKGSARRPELGHQPYQMGKAVSAPAQYTPIQVRELLNSVPRICLSHLPTPLDLAPRLSERLGITLRIKREDCAGLTFGGNYARVVEFTLADALAANADAVIHGAAGQSNRPARSGMSSGSKKLIQDRPFSRQSPARSPARSCRPCRRC